MKGEMSKSSPPSFIDVCSPFGLLSLPSVARLYFVCFRVIHRHGVLNICVKYSVKPLESVRSHCYIKVIFLTRPVSDTPIKGF